MSRKRAYFDRIQRCWPGCARPAATSCRSAPLTIGEIQKGVENLRDRDPIRASEIESWLDEAVLQHFEVLAFDSAAAREWARLIDGLPADLTIDAMIAATALVHGLTVVTRNERDFEQLAVPTLNPFEYIG